VRVRVSIATTLPGNSMLLESYQFFVRFNNLVMDEC